MLYEHESHRIVLFLFYYCFQCIFTDVIKTGKDTGLSYSALMYLM